MLPRLAAFAVLCALARAHDSRALADPATLTYVCNPASGCQNVCGACCHSDIAPAQCQKCAAAQCATMAPTPAPTPPTPSPRIELGNPMQSDSVFRDCVIFSCVWVGLALAATARALAFDVGSAVSSGNASVCDALATALVGVPSGFITVYAFWPTVLALPLVYGADCTNGIPWASHGLFIVLCACQVTYQLVSVIMDGENKRAFWKLGPGPRLAPLFALFHVTTSVLSRLDTYTDLCFVVIAHACGSTYATAATVVFVVCTTLGHVVPYWAFCCDDERRAAVTNMEDGLSISRKMSMIDAKHNDLHLTYELACTKHNQNKKDVMALYGPMWCRCVFEDILQSVLQILFLKEQQQQHSLDSTADSTVMFSVGVSLAMTAVAGVKGCYALAVADGKVPPLEFKSVAMTITGQPVAISGRQQTGVV